MSSKKTGDFPVTSSVNYLNSPDSDFSSTVDEFFPVGLLLDLVQTLM
jgi:hypothetical protein